ncbi:Transcriptional regulator [Lobulomyces angularis]|nr:Transcriptional regulator [Lobulomyces angularis]
MNFTEFLISDVSAEKCYHKYKSPSTLLPKPEELKEIKKELLDVLKTTQLTGEILIKNQKIFNDWKNNSSSTAATLSNSSSFQNNSNEKLKLEPVDSKVNRKRSHSIEDKVNEEAVISRTDGTNRISLYQKEGFIRVGIAKLEKPSPPPHSPSASTNAKISSVGKKDTQLLLKKRKVESESLSANSTPPSSVLLYEEVSMDMKNMSGDYSKAKAQNQIPLNTFIAYTDQYFRNLTEEDLKWLDRKDDEVTPYIIPESNKKHYLDQWASQDKSHSEVLQKVFHNSDLGEEADTVYPGDIYFGSLSERILSSLLEEGIVENHFEDEQDVADNTILRKEERTYEDVNMFEERVRNELKYIGLISENEDDERHMDNDEISVELRQKQAELRKQVKINNKRKCKLYEVSKNFMAYQEFLAVLDETDKTIEAAYSRRFKAVKKQKKKLTKEARPVSESVLNEIEKRKTWLSELAQQDVAILRKKQQILEQNKIKKGFGKLKEKALETEPSFIKEIFFDGADVKSPKNFFTNNNSKKNKSLDLVKETSINSMFLKAKSEQKSKKKNFKRDPYKKITDERKKLREERIKKNEEYLKNKQEREKQHLLNVQKNKEKKFKLMKKTKKGQLVLSGTIEHLLEKIKKNEC